MNKKGFFGYGHCPHCDAFLKEKDLEKNTCWSCNQSLDKEKSKDSYDIEKILGHVEQSININNESYDKNGMINYLNKADKKKLNKFFELFLSRYNLVFAETFAAKQMLIEPKYDTDYSYQDKRLNIYKSIKEDLEKLINKEGAELPPHI